MPESRARTVFFPYLCADQGLVVRLSKCLIDDHPAEVEWHQDSLECDLSPLSNWQRADLTFELEPELTASWVPELVPAAERGAPPVELLASLHCQRTFSRSKSVGLLDIHGRKGTVAVRLERSALSGAADLDFFIVRATGQQSDFQFASDAGARLMTSRAVSIRVDEAESRVGAGLKVEWESFSGSKHRYRRAHSGALFHLDLGTGSQPILFLNSDADPDLLAVLKEHAPGGRRAAIRNSIFAGIAVPVWNCLLRAALGAVSEEDGEVDAGWERKVLAYVARSAEPDCDPAEGMRRLIRNMQDPEAQKRMEESLPVILSELVMLRERAEAAVGVLR